MEVSPMPRLPRVTTREDASARREPVELALAQRLHANHLLRIGTALQILQDLDSPCWQMAFDDIYGSWTVQISRFDKGYAAGKRALSAFSWSATDDVGIHLNGSGEEHATPGAAWNAAANGIAVFLRSAMTFAAHPIPPPSAAP